MIRESFVRSVRNISRFGDTDILPYPFEQHILFDCEDAVVGLLEQAHKEFFVQKEGRDRKGIAKPSFLDVYEPVNIGIMAPNGYTGFRWATQIDPFWNAYLLGLLIELGDKIERERIPISEQRVFSYRFQWDETNKTLYRPDIGWRQFMEHSNELAAQHPFVLICDIADFYPRVYHHRVQNALLHVADAGSDLPKRIDTLLNRFSGGTSYGLPVGGPAARL